MTKGRKSICTTLFISNNQNPENPFQVEVQASKNLGICDMTPRVEEILSDFQGRQLAYVDIYEGLLYLNSEVIIELKKALTVALNPKQEEA